MERPTITRFDIKLRLFIDTNILIDYIEEYDQNKAKSFIELFKNSMFENIELVTSDYVLWEFYGRLRENLYVKKMIVEKDWGFNRARKGIKDFNGATREDMLSFGNEINKRIQTLEKVVPIQRVMSEKTEGFSEILERLLQFSKFSHRDSIILISGIYTKSHTIITIDQQFKMEGSRITELEKEKESLPIEFLEKSGLIELKFKKPEEFSSKQNIKKNYKEWFIETNQEKQIGRTINYLTQQDVIIVKCINDYTLKIDDYIYLVKFNNNYEAFIKLFQIKHGNFRDYESAKDIEEGEKGKLITIKLPDDFNPENINLKDSIIFLSEEYE